VAKLRNSTRPEQIAIAQSAVQKARKAAPSFRAVLVQGFRDPRERGEQSLAFYVNASREALSAREADLLVWPEGADPWPIDLTRGVDPWRVHRAAEPAAPRALAAGPFKVPLVTGGTGFDAHRLPRLSGILLYVRPGEPPLFYEKNIRMPFGEVIPLVSDSLLERLGVPVRTIARGTDNPALPFRGKTFRSLICYEAVFPGYFRRAAEGADFLVNITEDMWYGRTAHIPQHASVLRLRAVENRIPLLRVSNVGPSGVFDLTGSFHGGQKVYEEEVVFVEWRAASLPTVYARGGHLLPRRSSSSPFCAALSGSSGRGAARRLFPEDLTVEVVTKVASIICSTRPVPPRFPPPKSP
jgi:apolipoprotein N-acyltransferase